MAATNVHVIQNTAAFVKLREEWQALLAASGADCVFLTWEWLFTWWQHFSRGRRLFVITVRSGGELVAIAPLAMRRRSLSPLRLLPTLELLGGGDAGSDYLDIIVRPGAETAVRSALAEYFNRRGLMLDLPRVTKAGSMALALARELEGHGWSHAVTGAERCPYVTLANHSWPSYLATLGNRHRYNFRRRVRHLQRNYQMRFECVDSEDRRHDALSVLIKLHNGRWRNRGGSTAFHTRNLRRFHEAVTARLLACGWLRLFVLWLDGTPAAALYGLLYRGKFYFYQSGFDSNFGRFSVGLVTMGLAIEQAIGEHAREYDLLHGDEPYKFLWANGTREVIRLEVYPPRVRGLIYRTTVEARRSVRRLAHRLVDQLHPPGAQSGDIERARQGLVVPSSR